MTTYLLAIDQGTTSSRAIVFRQDLTVAALVPALGLFVGTRRARGGALLAGLALRLLRRRPA